MNAVARLRQAQDSHNDDESALFDLIRDRSFRLGKFTLSSGAESDLYFNLKSTMMSPRGAYLCAQAFLSRIWPAQIDFVGGLEMGAVPIIGSLAAVSEMRGNPVKTFFVRKEAKKHGTKDLIEGLGARETLSGTKVMVVDDVATSGGSILKAIIPVRAAGATADTAMVLVDREEGAAEFLKGHGVQLISVFKGHEFR
jgi:orotate phosphoribosyltransferase